MDEAASETLSGRPAAFPAEEFVARRRRLMERMGTGAALIQGAGPVERSEGFRQTNELYYLCGIEAPQTYLLMDGARKRVTAFLPQRDERIDRNEGPGLWAEDEPEIRRLSGVDAVRPLQDLAHLLGRMPEIYTPFSPAEGAAAYRDELVWAAARATGDPWDGRVSRESLLVEKIRRHYPGIEIRNLSPLLDELRLIKSPAEIERMRRAGELTALGVIEAMRSTRPGMAEYELGAAAQYVFRMNGAQGEGYRPIIASGENIWFTHYWRNDTLMAEGSVVLMDYAPDYGYYTSDIGRTWPVGGKFNDQQRELYSFITRYHQELLKRIRPGVGPARVMEETAVEMKPVVEATGFSKPIYREAARRALEFSGHLSHPVGMAVHDVGSYRDRPMEPGLVFSVDPQLWIPEEKLYVRVEDTVVVTESGVEVLTATAPLELDQIEALVGSGNAGQARINH